MKKLLFFVLLFIISLNNVHAEHHPDVARLDRISKFADRLLSKKPNDEGIRYSELEVDVLKENLTNYILTLLENPEHFKRISEVVINNPKILSEQDRAALLVLCIERFARDNHLAFKGQENEEISTDFYDYFVPYSKIYKLNKTDVLFVWSTGSGAHNNGYCVWIISIGSEFTAKQLGIQIYNDSNSLENKPSINAGSSHYNNKTKTLTFKSNDGLKIIYKLDKDGLHLVPSTSSRIYFGV